jgi:hypothetical protein
MPRLILIVFLLLFLSGVRICGAGHPLITDDAGTAGQGVTQIEVNSEYEREKDRGTKERTFSFSSSITYGVIEAGDIVLSTSHLLTRTDDSSQTQREHGIGDLAAEFKWRWYEKNGLSLAFKPGFVLPTGNDRRGLGTGKVGYTFFFIATQELKALTLHGNVGYLKNENTQGEREDLWHISLAGEAPLSASIALVGNVGLCRDNDPSSKRERSFALAGLIWTLSKSFSVDGGLKYSFARGGYGWSALGGLAFQF